MRRTSASLALVISTAIILLVISACSISTPTPATDAKNQSPVIEGQAYVLSPLTAATWTARSVSSTVPVTESPEPSDNQTLNKSVLIHAIEKASGCKVTDTDVSHGGTQLDAQIDCANSLEN